MTTFAEINCQLLVKTGVPQHDDLTQSMFDSARGVRLPGSVLLPALPEHWHSSASSKKSPHTGSDWDWQLYLRKLLAHFLQWRSFQWRLPLDVSNPTPPPCAPSPGAALRAVSWHCHPELQPMPAGASATSAWRCMFAAARRDDTIFLYDLNLREWATQKLSHSLQSGLWCMEWRPQSGCILAVGVRCGICLWRLTFSASNNTLPVISGGHMIRFLQAPGHAPVQALSWQPNGRLLASASTSHPAVMLWEPQAAHATALSAGPPGCGVLLVLFSPSNDYLFAATTRPWRGKMLNTLRVWETKTWKWETWTDFTAPCQSACWSSDGKMLLVAVQGDCAIHALLFPKRPPLIGGQYTGRYDLSAAVHSAGVPSTSPTLNLAVKQMVWDHSSQRLVVYFTNKSMAPASGQADNDGQPSPIVLLSTRVSPTLQLTCRGAITGYAEDGRIVHMGFPRNFPGGALLTICAEDGKISFIPLHFQANRTVENIYRS